MKLMYRLVIQNTTVYTGTSLITLIENLVYKIKIGDSIEIYKRMGLKWDMVDGAIWKAERKGE